MSLKIIRRKYWPNWSNEELFIRQTKRVWVLIVVIVVVAVAAVASSASTPDDAERLAEHWERRTAGENRPNPHTTPLRDIPCVGGFADEYPCENVDLVAFMPFDELGGGVEWVNDIWGWIDPVSGRNIVLLGRRTGTLFIDISDPLAPVYLGILPTQTDIDVWRDIKVYANHAYIVSEAVDHGMQIIDLTQLPTTVTTPITFTATAHYDAFGPAHNIAINEASGFAYAVGTPTCGAGLHMIDLAIPAAPVQAGCFGQDGYVHDAQCVNYAGPDPDFVGRELCFTSNIDTLTIVDVTDKAEPTMAARETYSGVEFAHQGWLTEDHAYFLMNDEGDERVNGHNTTTYIWDVREIAAPTVIGLYRGPSAAIDHNLYIRGNFAYESNYRAGLQILDVSDVAAAELTMAGFFDLFPANDDTTFNGTWSNYPFFDNGIVAVAGTSRGLFLLRPRLPAVGDLFMPLVWHE